MSPAAPSSEELSVGEHTVRPSNPHVYFIDTTAAKCDLALLERFDGDARADPEESA